MGRNSCLYLHYIHSSLELTINGGCSLYVPVRSCFEAAVSIMRGIWRGLSCSPSLFWALKLHERQHIGVGGRGGGSTHNSHTFSPTPNSRWYRTIYKCTGIWKVRYTRLRYKNSVQAQLSAHIQTRATAALSFNDRLKGTVAREACVFFFIFSFALRLLHSRQGGDTCPWTLYVPYFWICLYHAMQEVHGDVSLHEIENATFCVLENLQCKTHCAILHCILR